LIVLFSKIEYIENIEANENAITLTTIENMGKGLNKILSEEL